MISERKHVVARILCKAERYKVFALIGSDHGPDVFYAVRRTLGLQLAITNTYQVPTGKQIASLIRYTY